MKATTKQTISEYVTRQLKRAHTEVLSEIPDQSNWKQCSEVRKRALEALKTRRMMFQGQMAAARYNGDFAGMLHWYRRLYNNAKAANMMCARIDAAAMWNQPSPKFEPTAGYIEALVDPNAKEDGKKEWKEFDSLRQVPEELFKAWARSAVWAELSDLALSVGPKLPKANPRKIASVNFRLNQLVSRRAYLKERIASFQERDMKLDQWEDGQEPYANADTYLLDQIAEFDKQYRDVIRRMSAIKAQQRAWVELREQYNKLGGRLDETYRVDAAFIAEKNKERVAKALYGE